MKIWIVCPKCLDSWLGFPGAFCYCGAQTVVAPLIKQDEYNEIWEEIDFDDLEDLGTHKNGNLRCTVFEYCDGDLHFAANKRDEFLYAYVCNC